MICTQATLSAELLDASEDEKILNPDIDPGSAEVDKYDRERRIKEQREKELSAPAVKELKKAALDFHDNWRISVVERVNSVVNSAKETASEQVKSAKAPEGTEHSPADVKIDPQTLKESEDETAEELAAKTLANIYPPIETPLSSLDEQTRLLILHSTLLLLLSLEHYVAHSRVLLLYLTSSLSLPLQALTTDEGKVAIGLLEAAKHMSGEAEARKKAEENQQSRKWKVGLASVAGAAVIGITGGLAAPLVAAGIGSVMGGLGLGATAAAGYLGTVAGSSIIVGGLFGAYGGRMTGQMMDNYAREVEDFAFLPVRESLANIDKETKEKEKKENSTGDNATPKPSSTPQEDKNWEKESLANPQARRLRVTIGITGWLTSKEEVVTPWRILSPDSEVFALRWELEALLNLGNSITTMISTSAWGYAKKELIKRSIFAELMSAMWPLAVLQISRVVDNPFSVARSRSEKAGEVLADAIINKAQGERPVTLVGYSLGARVIYSCLMVLAKRRAFGLVESVVLIGAPTPSDTADWRILRSVVASRLVNIYSSNDLILGFLYRTSSIQYGVAGLQKIEGLPSVENVDVSETVSGHLRYRYLVGAILKKIGFEGLDLSEVKREEDILRDKDEEEEVKKLFEQGKLVGEKVLADGKVLVVGKDGKLWKDGKVWRDYGADFWKGKSGESKDGGEGVEEDGKKELSKEEAEIEAERMEKEVKAKTEKGLVQRMKEGLNIK